MAGASTLRAAANEEKGRRGMRKTKLAATCAMAAALILTPLSGLGPQTSHAAVEAAGAASAANPCDPDDLPGGSEGPDDDGDECGFTVTGHVATPTPSSGFGEFAEGSAALAKTCDPISFYAYKIDGYAVEDGFSYLAPTGALFLGYFLRGRQAPFNLLDGSDLSNEVRDDPQFQALDRMVQGEVKRALEGNTLDIHLTSSIYRGDHGAYYMPLDFSRSGTANDLAKAFGGTQGLDIKGSGYLKDGRYVGQIAYTIRDVYGFYDKDKFLGISEEMHYLQGVCGAPAYPGGAHWFYTSVTVIVPFDQNS
jgi:hypothetical protein